MNKSNPVNAFIAREPNHRTEVRLINIYTISQKKDKTKLTLLSNLCSRNCGIVYIFFSKNNGKKYFAITIRAIAAVNSQTAIAIPTTKPWPDIPIICSAEIFAAISEAPIAHHGRDLPAKK